MFSGRENAIKVEGEEGLIRSSAGVAGVLNLAWTDAEGIGFGQVNWILCNEIILIYRYK